MGAWRPVFNVKLYTIYNIQGGDIVDWAQLIGSLGFPIVACLGMGWYVKYQTDSYKDEVKDMRAEHKEEISKMSEALNNNTLALQKLCDKLDDKEKE